MSDSLLGGWSSFGPVTSEDKKVFNEATSGLIGVDYTPEKVSTQVVNGTNYRFQCSATIPNGTAIWLAMVEIYAPINGKPIITQITKL